MIGLLRGGLGLETIEIWFQDEARAGQRGTLTRIWAAKGSRPRAVRQQQFQAAYVFGAVCPTEGKAAALVMPKANSDSMQHHLDLISIAITPGKHGVLVEDRAAWHMTGKLLIPENLSILPLPPYSPELNPVEQVWQQLRQSDWANRCFADYDQIVDVCCNAWNQFASQPDIIRNLCTRQWTVLI